MPAITPDPDKSLQTYGHHIEGAYVEPASGEYIDSRNPYTGEVWARVPRGNAEDADRAVAAAARAMREGPWARMYPSARGRLMQRLAEVEVRDNGKLLAEMLGQVRYNPEWWRYFGGLADKLEGSVVPIDKPDMMVQAEEMHAGEVNKMLRRPSEVAAFRS